MVVTTRTRTGGRRGATFSPGWTPHSSLPTPPSHSGQSRHTASPTPAPPFRLCSLFCMVHRNHSFLRPSVSSREAWAQYDWSYGSRQERFNVSVGRPETCKCKEHLFKGSGYQRGNGGDCTASRLFPEAKDLGLF